MNTLPKATHGWLALERLEPHFGAIVFGTGLAVRVVLIHVFPLIYGVDSAARLVNSHSIFLAHQLPSLQAVIYVLAKFTEDPLAVRYFMAFTGAVAGVGTYRLGTDLLGRSGGFAVGLLFATQPFIVLYSIVPYLEIVMLAGLLFAFHHFLNERWIAAALWLGLACLSRYEAWIACPVLAAAYAWRGGLRPAGLARGVLLFGWAPLAWMALQHGLSPAGTVVIDFSLPLDRSYRYLYVGYIGLTNTPVPVLLLALLGIWQVRKTGLWRSKGFLPCGAYVLLFLGAILFSAHGDRDRPDRYVSAREAHIPLVAGIVLAVVGLRRLPRYRRTALGICAASGVAMAAWFVHRETSEPRLRLSYDAASYLDSHVAASERAVLLAKPVPAESLAKFLREAEARSGEAGARQAAEILKSVNPMPLDAQRIVIHSRLGSSRLVSLAGFIWPQEFDRFAPGPGSQPNLHGDFQWAAAWSDFEPSNEPERELAVRLRGETPVEVLERDNVAVRFYRLAY